MNSIKISPTQYSSSNINHFARMLVEQANKLGFSNNNSTDVKDSKTAPIRLVGDDPTGQGWR